MSHWEGVSWRVGCQAGGGLSLGVACGIPAQHAHVLRWEIAGLWWLRRWRFQKMEGPGEDWDEKALSLRDVGWRIVGRGAGRLRQKAAFQEGPGGSQVAVAGRQPGLLPERLLGRRA